MLEGKGLCALQRGVVSGFQKLVLSPLGPLVFMKQHVNIFSLFSPTPSQGVFPSDSPISVNATNIYSVALVLKLGAILGLFSFSHIPHPVNQQVTKIRPQALYILLSILSATL